MSNNPGRVAGFWYLLLSVIAPMRLMYIPSKLFVRGNATATVNNIAVHEWLFRFGIVGDLVCAVILIFLVMAFYRLFNMMVNPKIPMDAGDFALMRGIAKQRYPPFAPSLDRIAIVQRPFVPARAVGVEA